MIEFDLESAKLQIQDTSCSGPWKTPNFSCLPESKWESSSLSP